MPFWRDPAGGVSHLWSYVDTRDCGQAARLAIDCQAIGHHACQISAADTSMPIPTRQLIAEYIPGAPAPSDSLPTYGGLFDLSRARELLGFAPRYGWEDYGLGTRAELAAIADAGRYSNPIRTEN